MGSIDSVTGESDAVGSLPDEMNEEIVLAARRLVGWATSHCSNIPRLVAFVLQLLYYLFFIFF